MPRYFIDTDDGDFPQHDDAGYDLPDDEAARKMALAALPDMARDKIQYGDHRVFKITVRDERGDVTYAATLTLEGRQMISRPHASDVTC